MAADHRHKKIVVAIRGTLSLADALTDLAAKPVPLADDPGGNIVSFFRDIHPLSLLITVYSQLRNHVHKFSHNFRTHFKSQSQRTKKPFFLRLICREPWRPGGHGGARRNGQSGAVRVRRAEGQEHPQQGLLILRRLHGEFINASEMSCWVTVVDIEFGKSPAPANCTTVLSSLNINVRPQMGLRLATGILWCS